MIKLFIPLLVALETADGILTHSAVGKDLVHEGNPILQNSAGSGSYLMMKVCGAFLCALLLWLIYRRFPRISLIATSGILLFYALVFTWNLSILFKFSLS